MSELILPEYLAKAAVEPESQAVTDEETVDRVARQLPIPCGYQMLVSLPKIEEKYDSGLVKADSVVRSDEIATVVAFVVRLGPDAYKDNAKFPTGPYCKEGDFVLLRAYQGNRFKIHGVEFRMINDDSVIGVVIDPRGYSRI